MASESKKVVANHAAHLGGLVEESQHSFKKLKELVDYLIVQKDAQ